MKYNQSHGMTPTMLSPMSVTSLVSKPPSLVLTLLFFLGFSSVDLNLVFKIFKLYSFSFGTFFQIQKPLGQVQNLSLIPCTHYTLPKLGYCIHLEFYNKLTLGIT